MAFKRVLQVAPAMLFLTAVMPMSPALEPATRAQTIEALKKAGLTEVATSSVVVSLLQVLGSGDEARSYEYREPYDHLAHVDAKSTAAGPNCLKADLSIWMPKQPGRRATLAGTYCRTEPENPSGAYFWRAQEQSVKGAL